MNFTYNEYEKLIEYIKLNEYNICKYNEHKRYKKVCILRHDVDQSLENALELALLEYKMNVTSTYFILLSSDFYNISSKKNIFIINKIIDLGHDIGLHFDEAKYSSENIIENINKEIKIMSDIIDYKVEVVSMHRPSKNTLQSNYKIEGIINSYSREFFNDFKYISDSRRNWRENPYEVVGNYDKLHILTHPFWYEKSETSTKIRIKSFIDESTNERYRFLKQNISNINEIILEGEVK